ncbi:GrpB family protein [Paenibacillus agricola]|uniref:GrpB family protein n=1 Tax=Paenibacillus agricola TaxID=2716264 RepID=A0ABX0J4R2_9BACL|nr:GrpB family protein [Paenibacillus agricola]
MIPYDPNWSVLFAEEAYSIKNAISDIVSSIEHFGSTSVYGLDVVILRWLFFERCLFFFLNPRPGTIPEYWL